MLGKTHMAVGVAAALVVLKPDNFAELFVGTAVAAVGSVINDIDVDTSDSHKWANRIILLTVLSALVIVSIDYLFGLKIYHKLLQHQDLKKIFLGSIGVIIICAFGKEQPHRSFMHSVLALFLLSVCVWIVLPQMMPYFSVAFLSHMVLDVMNCKKIRLWYPLDGGYCMKLCKSDGLANSIFLLIGVAVAVLQFVWCFYMIVATKLGIG